MSNKQQIENLYAHRNALIIAWLRAKKEIEQEFRCDGTNLWRTKKTTKE